MREELENLLEELERLHDEYALDYDVSVALVSLADEIAHWMGCQDDE